MYIGKNNEGYNDPTPTEALANIKQDREEAHRKRPIVFICSPYAGDIQKNVNLAREYCRFAVDKGYLPIAPHLLFPQFLKDGDAMERELGLGFGFQLLGKCRELWVFGSNITPGMKEEISRARWMAIPIREFREDCQEANDA